MGISWLDALASTPVYYAEYIAAQVQVLHEKLAKTSFSRSTEDRCALRLLSLWLIISF